MRDPAEINKERATKEVAALSNTSHAELRSAWRQLYKQYPPKFLNRDLLELGVAWKIQERALGGHSAATKRQLDALADTLEAKADIAKSRRIGLRPGAKLIRAWRGKTHEVVVLEDGFTWNGKHWRSLSLIAREITGTRWSGPRFFGINERIGSRRESEAAQ
ncbi:MAG: DUF2924 domain-containing protein [Alphaproteobacteria bacterium]|nr:DUF2924 domain-containing protein [Alphaproteobacteria bacterium]